MMTAKEAKEVCLRVWSYLADHPEISCKLGLPEDLWNEIRGMHFYCPLCEYFILAGLSCLDCPLFSEGAGGNKIPQGCWQGSFYAAWDRARGPSDRQMAATNIVNRVQAWDAEGV
jgi:hypothetical protein